MSFDLSFDLFFDLSSWPATSALVGMSLNSKKSWDPTKSTNKAKVAKREDERAEQLRLAETRRRELAEEQELADLKARVNPKGKQTRLPWMYDSAIESKEKTMAVPKRDARQAPQERASLPKQDEPLDFRKHAKLSKADPFAQIKRSRPKDRISKK